MIETVAVSPTFCALVPGLSTFDCVLAIAQGVSTVTTGVSSSLTFTALRSAAGETEAVGVGVAAGLTDWAALGVGATDVSVAPGSSPPQALSVISAAAAVPRRTRRRFFEVEVTPEMVAEGANTLTS